MKDSQKVFDIDKVRSDFPILQRKVFNKTLVYLDNAATTQKPTKVIQRLARYYEQENANIHRGVHYLSQISTESFENVREKVRAFLNAEKKHEIIFTRGTTESINLVASSFSDAFLKEGDEVLITEMEHHSNIVPWQMACQKHQAELKYVPITNKGELDEPAFEKMLSKRVKILALTHLSNALGTINPLKKIIKKAKAFNIPVLIDGAQAAAHLKVDVRDLDCDFYCFSGHKVYGPMGVGVLYGKEKILESMPPYQGGGEMIKEVSLKEGTTYNELPFKFEAGTPNVSDVIGLEAALDYINDIGLTSIGNYEDSLLTEATHLLNKIDGLHIIGQAQHKSSVLSFIVDQVHPYDVGTLLDKMGIAVRTGHHCAQPVMEKFGISGTIRASFAFYNSKYEIELLRDALQKALSMLR